jgi:lysophospholipase L1-like esterase
MIGVVIGDSIAEGYPALWGRLQADQGTQYDSNYPNITGQFSTELSRLFGYRFYNHGIISQKSGDIWARWNRDVLAQVYDPSDGRGNQTLSEVPHLVFVHVGVNDFNAGIDINTVKDNFTNMMASLQTNSIQGIFSNVPTRDDLTTTERNNVISFNTWLASTAPTYNIKIFDEYSWCIDDNNSPNVRFDYYNDGVHPNKEGYRLLSQLIYETYTNS